MQEEIEQIDANWLQEALVAAIGSQADSSRSWASLVEQILTEAGYDISGVRFKLEAATEKNPLTLTEQDSRD